MIFTWLAEVKTIPVVFLLNLTKTSSIPLFHPISLHFSEVMLFARISKIPSKPSIEDNLKIVGQFMGQNRFFPARLDKITDIDIP